MQREWQSAYLSVWATQREEGRKGDKKRAKGTRKINKPTPHFLFLSGRQEGGVY